jgi:limonene-1,2-epoxide hydrolase
MRSAQGNITRQGTELLVYLPTFLGGIHGSVNRTIAIGERNLSVLNEQVNLHREAAFVGSGVVTRK